ncbi:hypothetical protein ACF06X_32180 [Streptomyces sp. NPDC015346]|uniref:hypothetical protein n=1 Tax=Streptomyces sp. NPDC015346 TaxID=3364954 RepID=UPI00370296C4
MNRTRAGALAAVCSLLLALTTAACTEEDRAKVGDIVSSATAAAASKMGEVKDGVNATGDVKAGPTRTDGDRTVAEITATNGGDGRADYTIMVNFRDGEGNLLDSVVLAIDGVEPGKSGTGTARSNRTLPGETTADIAQALRH